MVDVEALKVEEINLVQQSDGHQGEIDVATAKRKAVDKRLRIVRELIRLGEAFTTGKELEEDIPF